MPQLGHLSKLAPNPPLQRTRFASQDRGFFRRSFRTEFSFAPNSAPLNGKPVGPPLIPTLSLSLILFSQLYLCGCVQLGVSYYGYVSRTLAQERHYAQCSVSPPSPSSFALVARVCLDDSKLFAFSLSMDKYSTDRRRIPQKWHPNWQCDEGGATCSDQA